jgi:ferrochelatase
MVMNLRTLGGEHVQLVESLNDHPLWIDALAELSKGEAN